MYYDPKLSQTTTHINLLQYFDTSPTHGYIMPTATRVLLINGVNTGISYPINNNDTDDNTTTQPQGQMMNTEQQLDDSSSEKRSIESSTIRDGQSPKRPKSNKEDQTNDTPTCFSVAHPRDSQYLSPRQC